MIVTMGNSPNSEAAGDARQFAMEQARSQGKHLALQISRAVKSCSAEAVHQVRVAIRRFTQTVAVSRAYVPGADFKKNRKRLKKIMAGAGEVRNCDVALKLVTKFRAPHAVSLRAKLRSRRTESARALVSDLRKWRERKISATLLRGLDAAPVDGDESAIHELAHKTLGRIAKEFLKQGKEAALPHATPKGLHRFRIAAKKFRYALELFQPLFSSALDPVVAGVKGASALLGDINDCVTVAAMVEDYKGGQRLAERLKKRQHKKTAEFRSYWKDEFGDGARVREAIDSLKAAGPLKKPAASSRTAHSPRNAAAGSIRVARLAGT
jgi:CHAD domain-containing protein